MIIDQSREETSRPKSSGAIDDPPVEVVRANVGVVPHSQGVQRVLEVNFQSWAHEVIVFLNIIVIVAIS